MITIRSNPYSKEECLALSEALAVAEDYIIRRVCGDIHTHCKVCAYRHVCNDLTSAKEHAEALAHK